MKTLGSCIRPVKEPFSGYQTQFNEASYVIFGVPYDKTSTYRLGSRLGPKAVRRASLNIETYSPRTDLYVEDLKMCDLGNVKVAGSLDCVTEVTSKILDAGKMPVILGGEHTLTYYALNALPRDTALVSFDAHYDLRDEYNGRKISHATVMRRIVDKCGPERIIFAGTRATSKEELSFVEKNKIHNITAHKILHDGWREAADSIKDSLQKFSRYYLTLDMDVLDPAHAPEVGNPEPEGLEVTSLLNIIHGFCDERLVGFDLVEVAPKGDFGITAIQAAKIIFEILCFIEAVTRRAYEDFLASFR
ncbi:MAG: agmatinase [Candidatus Bathyarchaeia archaeon]